MNPIYWRFFTRTRVDGAAVATFWAWERLDGEHVLAEESDFATLRAAEQSAREHGFSGNVDPDFAGIALRERQSSAFGAPM